MLFLTSLLKHVQLFYSLFVFFFCLFVCYFFLLFCFFCYVEVQVCGDKVMFAVVLPVVIFGGLWHLQIYVFNIAWIKNNVQINEIICNCFCFCYFFYTNKTEFRYKILYHKIDHFQQFAKFCTNISEKCTLHVRPKRVCMIKNVLDV